MVNSSSSVMTMIPTTTFGYVLLLITSNVVGVIANETRFHNRDYDNAKSRSERFPSVEERVKLYMSNWYMPPCETNYAPYYRYKFESQQDKEWPLLQIHIPESEEPLLATNNRMLEVESDLEPDKLFYLDRELVEECAITLDEGAEQIMDERRRILNNRIKFRSNLRMYCVDVSSSLFTAIDHIQWEQPDMQVPPMLLQFGDMKQSHDYGNVTIPHFKKFRSASISASELASVTADGACHEGTHPRKPLSSQHGDSMLQPIVWKLATHRHFDKMYQIYREDTPWNKKKDMAIFRGQLTGSRDGYDKHLSDEVNCHNLRRCRLVYDLTNSTLVSALLTNTRNRLPAVINGVQIMSKKISIENLLQYKGIIMLEGNDVASGLKWALLSQSVVLMPPPKHTSWAMEELLEPWVHYIPLDEFATNVEEQMQWVLDHDEESQRISARATRWMEDLVFHPDADEDDRLIQEEMIRRYQAHFQPV